MANACVTIEPCTLDEIVKAALADGFTVTDQELRDGLLVMCGLIHEDERGCYGMSEQEGDDGETYVGCMNDPEVPGHRMHQDLDF